MGRNIMKLDTSGMERMLKKLEEAGGDTVKLTEMALKKAALKIQNDTVSAVASSNLPAGGKYSTGDTASSIIHFAKVEWEGMTASIPVGFDFGKPGAGGFLISGTPRMRPDAQLKKMYKGKAYMSQIQNEMADEVLEAIIEKMEG